jgi:alpha-tubulin suppressor-like RCC1 family protein
MIVSLLNYRVFDIACGHDHTIAAGIMREMTKTKSNVDEIKLKDNHVFLFGDNSSGQIGIEGEAFSETPKLADFFLPYKIKKLECGFYHNVVLTGKIVKLKRLWKGVCLWLK